MKNPLYNNIVAARIAARLRLSRNYSFIAENRAAGERERGGYDPLAIIERSGYLRE